MKALVCEMCNSRDLVKENGVFVCQSCGTKYSVEDAKKLMIEGKIDISGSTVKIDNSQRLDNLYKLARRAMDSSDLEKALSYYNEILVYAPDCWEATLFSAYLAIDANRSELMYYINRMSTTIVTVINLIIDNVDPDDYQEALSVLVERVNFFSMWACEEAVQYHMECRESYTDSTPLNICEQDREECNANLTAAIGLLYDLGDYIEEAFNDNQFIFPLLSLESWKYGVIRHAAFIKKISGKEAKEQAAKFIKAYSDNIKKFDSGFNPPEVSTSGCYIATAVYGSYDCPQVWTLRRFRDNILATTWYGKLFIRMYYAISPSLVNLFGHKTWFNTFWKNRLDRMVANLQKNGIASTQYIDKE